jgi:hypothetical protein
MPEKIIPYKFKEDQFLEEFKTYIDSTYTQHYSGKEGNKIQVTEFIMEHCENYDWLKGNVIKYIARYGKKDGKNRKDILKALHYALLMLYYDDRDNIDTSKEVTGYISSDSMITKYNVKGINGN